MSSNLLAIPFRPVINQRGNFEAGAVMTVYKQGTTTLEPLFEDAALTTLINNPIAADGYGAFPPIYFSDSQTVRVLIAESGGTVLFDVDPYISTVFDAESVLDQAAAQAALAAASASEATAAQIACEGIEATAEALVGPTYASIAAGLAATVSGEYFAVVSGDTVSIYLNDAGSEVFQRSTLSSTAITAELADKADLVHTHAISDVTSLQTSLDAKAPLVDPAFTGTPTTGGIEVGYRSIPRSTTTTTAVVADRGKCIAASAGITIPASVYSEGDALSIYNDSGSDITITQGAGLTLRRAGTADTGDRTLGQRGLATIWFNSATDAVLAGAGIS